MDCLTCKSISGERRISPGPTIYETAHWLVEHAYPCSMKGWLVLVLKRHAQALHELTEQESRELGELQGMTTRVLFDVLDCEKEYSMCLAESAGFNHIHVHLVAKPRDLPAELRGVSIFALLKPGENTVPPGDIERFCEELQGEFVKMEGVR
ncbi:MAG TPA: HIT family protein [Chloroflexia bacterium]